MENYKIKILVVFVRVVRGIIVWGGGLGVVGMAKSSCGLGSRVWYGKMLSWKVTWRDVYILLVTGLRQRYAYWVGE